MTHDLGDHGHLVVSFNGMEVSQHPITAAGLARLGPTIIAMAEAEGLGAHAAAVRLRLENAS